MLSRGTKIHVSLVMDEMEGQQKSKKREKEHETQISVGYIIAAFISIVSFIDNQLSNGAWVP